MFSIKYWKMDKEEPVIQLPRNSHCDFYFHLVSL